MTAVVPPRQELLCHHTHVDTAVLRIRDALNRGRFDTVWETWPALRDELLSHLVAEESTILPSFARQHPDDAARVRSEHAVIRRMVAEAEAKVAARTLDRNDVFELLAYVRMHQANEEVGMYRWAASRADDATRTG